MPSSTFLWVYKNVPGVRYLQEKLNLVTSYVPPPPSVHDDQQHKKILLVHAHPLTYSFSSCIADIFEQSSKEAGHELQRISLNQIKFNPAMSSEERAEYFKNAGAMPPLDESHLSKDIQQHLRLLRWCDTLVFVYPTWWGSTPAILKGWLDRTLICGSAWDFPSNTEQAPLRIGLCPRLNNITNIVGISTYGASRNITFFGSGDGGRLMISNNIRHAISSKATVTWLGLYDMDQQSENDRKEFLKQVDELARDL